MYKKVLLSLNLTCMTPSLFCCRSNSMASGCASVSPSALGHLWILSELLNIYETSTFKFAVIATIQSTQRRLGNFVTIACMLLNNFTMSFCNLRYHWSLIYFYSRPFYRYFSFLVKVSNIRSFKLLIFWNPITMIYISYL